MRARGSLACSANRPPQTPLFLSPALAESLVFPSSLFNYSPFCLSSYFFFSLGWLFIVASFLIAFLFIVSSSATNGILFVETASRANETV